MSLSPRWRMALGIVLANVAVLAVAATVYIGRPPAPPQIQGVLLTEGRALQEFGLFDHRGEAFGPDALRGRWHLVSYGFTTCPDVCPTTLSALARVQRELGEVAPQVLFYSVDHRRDTVERMAAYVPFFDDSFIGLTHLDNPANPHLPFEQGLGITAQLQPLEEGEGYRVLHGVNLLLLNPAGELQAIFKPDRPGPDQHVFDPQQVAADYLAVREFVAGKAFE